MTTIFRPSEWRGSPLFLCLNGYEVDFFCYLLWACGQRSCVVHMSTGWLATHYSAVTIGVRVSICSLLLEEAIELSTSRVEGALLIHGRTVSDERSTFLVERCEHDLVDRALPEAGRLMQV